MKSQPDELFGSARIKIDPNLNLDHVVGQPEAVLVLRDLVRRLKHPEVYALWGLDKPKAIALTGPTGCGKSMTLRAMANEVTSPLVEMRYEDFASHLYDDAVQKLSQFKEYTEALSDQFGHVLIFVDEADVFFQSRFDVNTHSSDNKKTNFFLRWIDGDLEGSSNFTFLASSNAWESIDPAMRRPGRFTKVEFKNLSAKDILKCLEVHLVLLSKKLDRCIVSFELEEFASLEPCVPKELSGAGVKELLDKVVGEKAQSLLDRVLGNDSIDSILEEVDMISLEDLRKVLLAFKAKDTTRRGPGF